MAIIGRRRGRSSIPVIHEVTGGPLLEFRVLAFQQVEPGIGVADYGVALVASDDGSELAVDAAATARARAASR